MCLLLAFSIAPNDLKTIILGEAMQVAKISSVVGVLFVFVSIKKQQQQQLNNLKFPPLLVFCFVLDVFVKKKKEKITRIFQFSGVPRARAEPHS